MTLSRRGNIDEAINRLSEAIDLDFVSGDRKSEAQSRINRASLYAKQNRTNEAMGDYESGLDGLKPTLDRWKERLSYVNQHPLTVQEVANLRWDLHWIASAHTQFAQFLRSQGKIVDSREHSKLASELYQYIGENSEAVISLLLSDSTVAEKLLTFITSKSSVSLDEQTSAEGMHTCPSCNPNLEPRAEECPSCGQGFCSDCGTPIDEYAKACSKCGLKILYYCPECDSEVTADASACPNFIPCHPIHTDWNTPKRR